MATKYLASNDLDTADLANNDVLIVPETLGSDVDTNVDEGGTDLDAMIVHSLYQHNIASTGTPLQIAADSSSRRRRASLALISPPCAACQTSASVRSW